MESKQNISQYRGTLDKTLASHDLVDEETLKTLVKNQMLQSSGCEVEEYSDNVIEKRTKEVSNFLQMLRSASVNYDDGLKDTSHRGWKVKQDTEEYRVMYREGPQGTPFHTLLVEGYVDGPVDVCLCISWESTLYKKWCPQFTIPTFKILSSECLKKVRIGEDIALVRMKVSWPLSAREVVAHYFEFDYFQDDLTVVLLNSISDTESIDKSTHGFNKDGIPDVQDMVRIDVVGGFAIQKVHAGRSYFRTIVNMDIKLDFVPPSFINFIARQLLGSGFRLYKKEVASVTKGDEDFGKVLRGPMYTRIREALYSDNNRKGSAEPEKCQSESRVPSSEHVIKPIEAKERNDDATESFPVDTVAAADYKPSGEIEEIEEEEIENSGTIKQDDEEIHRPTTSEIAENCCVIYRKKDEISAEVKHALETLERVIFMIREHGATSQTRGLGNEQSLVLAKSAINDTKSSEDGQIISYGGVGCDEESKNKPVDRAHNEPRNSYSSLCSRHTGSNSYLREGNHSKIAPASPEDIPNGSETQQTAFSSSNNETTKEPIPDGRTNGNKLVVNGEANGMSKNSPNKGKNKRTRFCCLHFISGS